MKDFFISYNRADRLWGEWIAWQLEEAGHTTVVQAWDFRPGSNFVLEMQKAAEEAERTIAVLSPDYVKALYTQPEWAAAFAQDPTGEKGTLVPVRVRECDLKGLLPQIIYVDLVGLDEDAAKQALLDGVSRERTKPDVQPVFPGGTQRSVAERPRFPGALPPIWNVPHQRNPNFTGRESLLESLQAALASGQPAAVTQAISGLGGVGKTQLALEYAYRYASEYDGVWWVHSEEAATLNADYAALAGPLDLKEKDAADQSVIVEAVRRWLERNTGWLLVLDNAPGRSECAPYLPKGATGHVLITSRDQVWRGVATPLPVEVFDRAESVRFLLRRTGDTDEAAAGALAEELGDLPLALEQAASYIEVTGRSLSGYLELFRQRQQELLALGEVSDEYSYTVATTWELSFQQVEEAAPVAADLLRLTAFLAPDDIPLALLRNGAEHVPEPLSGAVGDPLELDDALAALRRYSLAQVAEHSLSVHRLVHAVVRERLDDNGRQEWAGAAVKLLNAAFPFDQNDPGTWAGSATLLPHALAAAAHTETLAVAPEATAQLLDAVGKYLRVRAQYHEAKTLFERALAIGEETYGSDHPNMAALVNNLGFVLRELGDLEGAQGHYERALVIAEASYEPDHPGVATHVNNLARILWELGDLEGARVRFERALAIFEKTHGPNHPNVATAVSNLGAVLRAQGDLEGARVRFERALAIFEKTHGPNHPNVATAVTNLGAVLRAQGDLEGARAHLERALAIDEKAYGLNHPEVATDINNMGTVLQDLGELEGARAHFERALQIRQQFLGDDHPDTVTVRDNLRALDA